jgi:hypothetical protein
MVKIGVIEMTFRITQEDLDYIWNENGFKYRISRFHKYLTQRGLLPLSVPKDHFINHFKEILTDFFVNGVRENEDGRREYPDTSGEDEGKRGRDKAGRKGNT